MENASKALIIAGAILISILLISVGVLIMNSTGDTQKSVEDQSKSIAIRTFNSQFTPYEGEGISASQVRALFSTINASNGANEEHEVKVVTGDDVIDSSSDVVSNKKYKVELMYTDKDGEGAKKTGYVQRIKITEN